MICMQSCFGEKLPKYFKDYARGRDPTHYYHQMPANLAQLLDGTQATVVMQGAKMAEMIYNTTGWLPLGGKCMTGQYGFEPEGQKCFSWFMNDELVFAMYIDQLVMLQLLNRLDELEQLHIPKTTLSILLNDGKTGGDVMNSIWYMKQPNLKQVKQKPLHTALWMRPENPLANIIQISGHSMETVHDIMHRIFLQYQVGTHSYE